MNGPNKLECLFQAGFFKPSLMFVDKARPRPRVETLEVVPFRLATALIAINILGCKSLPGTNTSAYLSHL